MSDKITIPELTCVRTRVGVDGVPARSTGIVVHAYPGGVAYDVEFSPSVFPNIIWTYKRHELEVVS